MNDNKFSLTLSMLRSCAYAATDEIALTTTGFNLFDGRSEFLIDDTTAGIAVLLLLTNEQRMQRNAPGCAVLRQVHVALIDDFDDRVLDSRSARVNMDSTAINSFYRVDFPINRAVVDPDHCYRLLVRDESTHAILGEQEIRFYDEELCATPAADWFAPVAASVTTMDGYKFRCYECTDDSYLTARFVLRPKFANIPCILPECEVRIYTPSDQIISRFVRPVRNYDRDDDTVILDVPFLASYYDQGVYYAEVVCMDYPVAGMVFSTVHSHVKGEWHGDNLKCMEEYSLFEAIDRFHDALESLYDGPEDTGSDTSLNTSSDTVKDCDVVDDSMNEILEREYAEAIDSLETLKELEAAKARAMSTAAEHDDCSSGISSVMWLDCLTGLKSVKEKLVAYEQLMRFNKMRIDNGFPTLKLPLHAMFLGSPGTGKTTVAKRMGMMLRQAGVLSRGHVVMRERSSLLGPNYSTEETKTLEAIEEAQGGILFIDEAYQLFQPNDPRDPGRLVIEALMTALADESRRDWMLILAGYPDEMKRMFDMNPGLKSRIPESNIYLFEDFSESELMEIAERYLNGNNFTLTDDARQTLARRLGNDYSHRDKTFGNARHVLTLIQTEILPAMAARVTASPKPDIADLAIIHATDIPQSAPASTGNPRPRIGYCA